MTTADLPTYADPDCLACRGTGTRHGRPCPACIPPTIAAEVEDDDEPAAHPPRPLPEGYFA